MSTIKDIAKKANVAIATVDRVLHKRKWVAPETKEKIERAIEELKYEPNMYARNLKLRKTYNFGVMLPLQNQDNGFWDSHTRGIEKALKEFENRKITIEYLRYDRTSEQEFISVMEKTAEAGLDGLLIAPLLSEQIERFLNTHQTNFPCVLIDSRVPNYSKYLSCIRIDAYQSGFFAAKMMKLLAPEGGTIAITEIAPKNINVEERVAGFVSYFAQYPQYTLKTVCLEKSKESAADANALLSSLFTPQDPVRGLFIAGGPVPLYAHYLYSNRLQGKVKTIAYDCIDEHLRYLQNNTIDFLIYQNPELQGYLGINSLYRYCVLSEEPQKDVFLPINIVAQENMKYI